MIGHIVFLSFILCRLRYGVLFHAVKYTVSLRIVSSLIGAMFIFFIFVGHPVIFLFISELFPDQRLPPSVHEMLWIWIIFNVLLTMVVIGDFLFRIYQFLVHAVAINMHSKSTGTNSELLQIHSLLDVSQRKFLENTIRFIVLSVSAIVVTNIQIFGYCEHIEQTHWHMF